MHGSRVAAWYSNSMNSNESIPQQDARAHTRLTFFTCMLLIYIDAQIQKMDFDLRTSQPCALFLHAWLSTYSHVVK